MGSGLQGAEGTVGRFQRDDKEEGTQDAKNYVGMGA